MASLSVCPFPALLDSTNIRNHCIVVIDIWRASSTIITVLAHGAQAVIPCPSENECRKLRSSSTLIAGERGGAKLPGFDFGNSPTELLQSNLTSKKLALSTTNGTAAIEAAKVRANMVWIGGFLNAHAILDKLHFADTDILLLCAGWENNPSPEDSAFAGWLASKLADDFSLDASAQLALEQWKSLEGNFPEALLRTKHANKLRKLGYDQDLLFCLEWDRFPIVPILRDDQLILPNRKP